MAVVLGALCQGAGLGRTLAAHDRPQLDQAATGRLRDRANRDHGAGLWRRLSQGLADWHAIIDGLAKPTFDGVLPLPDLAAAVAEARAAVTPDPRQVVLKRTITEIRARALAPAPMPRRVEVAVCS